MSYWHISKRTRHPPNRLNENNDQNKRTRLLIL